MGSLNVRQITTSEERKDFLYHLLNDIRALDKMIKNDLFEKGICRVGAEQEFCLVTEDFRPSKNALKILEKINDSHFTTELGVFNLEINLDPVELSGKCFGELEKELNVLLNKANEKAKSVENNRIVLTGILPSLIKNDLTIKNMTPLSRYKTLNKALTEMRGKEFKMVIKGVDELNIKNNCILFEAFNTSFQVHLQIPLDEIVDKYNWAQAIAGPVLSVISNSPLLLGRELWSETRIAVFQQSIDTRNTSYHLQEQKPRVYFGGDWIKDDITEVYKDDISRYSAIFTTDFKEDSMKVLNRGEIPKLKALSMHNGTIYKWNRLCYGITNGKPHFRIENRYIPSGPTVKDEIANTLFWVGLMVGMPDKYKEIWKISSFKDAKGNFINAARTGIDTYFNWFGNGISARKLVSKILIPMAKKGLQKVNIDSDHIDHYLDIIKKRVKKNQTGSKWIVRNFRALKNELSNDAANITITSAIYNRQLTGKPIAEWDAVNIEEGFGIANLYDKVRKVMTTEIFVAKLGDPLELINNIMNWKKINHLPVVDSHNKVIGMLSYDLVVKSLKNQKEGELLSAKDVMSKVIVNIDPETTIEEAKKIMQALDIDYLPIIDDEEMIGIFTQKDLNKIIKELDSNGES